MTPKKIAILAYPKLCTFEFGCAVELFALPRPDIKNWYQCDIVALYDTPMQATGGLEVQTNNILSKKNGFLLYDRVIIPGWGDIEADVPDSLLTPLRQFYKQGGEIVSFCSGAFVIASTGLLNNQQATTHWRYKQLFQKKFPNINFKDNVLFAQADRIYTSAGSASALDLGLSLIREDFGASVANQVAKRLVISSQREGGQAQFSENTEIIETNLLNGSLEWAKKNCQSAISIEEMAERACMSRRSFDRHFRLNLGSSPKEWLIQQRVYLARQYLENSQAKMDQIAEQSGFGSAMNLRHHFAKILGVSPSHYRNQFLQTSASKLNAKKPD